MKIQRRFSYAIDNAKFVSLLARDLVVVATSDDLIWYRISDSLLSEAARVRLSGRPFALFPLPHQGRAVVEIENSVWSYSLQLFDGAGFIGAPVQVPFSWIDEVTSDGSGSVLALYGTLSIPGRAGWIAPVESSLINIKLGAFKILAYPAVWLHDGVLYFVEGTTLYRSTINVSSLMQLAQPFVPAAGTEVVAYHVPSPVIALSPDGGGVWLATRDGIYACFGATVTLVQKGDYFSRARISSNHCFALGIGPEVHAYDLKGRAASSVTSSAERQVTGVDVYSPSDRGPGEYGILIIVTENGVLDLFSWSA